MDVPKEEIGAELMKIPLREEERAAVEDGLAPLERLETKLDPLDSA